MEMWNGINKTELVWVTPETDPVPDYNLLWWEIDPLTVPFIKDNLPVGFVNSPTAISPPYLVGYDFNHPELEQLCSVIQAHVIESVLWALDEDENLIQVDYWESKTHVDDFPEFWRNNASGISGPGADGDQDFVWYYSPNLYSSSVLTIADKAILISAGAGKKYISIIPPLAAVLLLSSFLYTSAPITRKPKLRTHN